MTGITQNGEQVWKALRVLAWGGAATLLALPFIAMRFTTEVAWTGFDFAIAFAMLATCVGAFELVTHLSYSIPHRIGVLVAVGTAILLFWVNGAVGFLGDEGNPWNMLFFGVIAIAFVGSVFAGFRAAGMARTMFAAAAAQGLIGIVALTAGLGSSGAAGVYEAAMGTGLFVTLWLVSAGLFRLAAKAQPYTV